jgi:hypothetical protein
VKVKDIEAMVQLKGLLKEEVKVYIDDKLCDSKEYGFEWLYEEGLGGETIGKFAGT